MEAWHAPLYFSETARIGALETGGKKSMEFVTHFMILVRGLDSQAEPVAKCIGHWPPCGIAKFGKPPLRKTLMAISPAALSRVELNDQLTEGALPCTRMTTPHGSSLEECSKSNPWFCTRNNSKPPPTGLRNAKATTYIALHGFGNIRR